MSNTSDFYDNPDLHSHLRYDSGSFYGTKIAGRVAQALLPPGKPRVLEIGAGMGRFTLHLAPQVRHLTAVDLSVELLREMPASANVRRLYADCMRLSSSLIGSPFDAVCGFFVLHHIENHAILFESIRRILTPGGRIAFVEPNRLNPSFLAQIIVSPEMTWRDEKCMFSFSARRTVDLLRRWGWQNVERETFGFFPPAILDRFRAAQSFEHAIETSGLARRLLPFWLITAQK